MNKIQIFRNEGSPLVFIRFDENYLETVLPKQAKVAALELTTLQDFKQVAKDQYGIEFNSFNFQLHGSVSPVERIILGDNSLIIPLEIATISLKEKFDSLVAEIESKAELIEPPKAPKFK